MHDFIHPILALSTGEIVSIVIAILVILSGIFGQANETKKTQRRREALKRGDAPERSSGGSELDDIAQRRRQQLEALARQRRGGSTASTPMSASATRTAERTQARAEVDARNEAVRDADTASQRTDWGDEGNLGGQAQYDAKRAQAEAYRAAKANEAAQRAEARRAQQLREQAQRAASQQKAARQAEKLAKQRQLAARAAQQRVEEPPPRRGLGEGLGAGATTVDTSAYEHDDAYESDNVHRHVPDAVNTPDTPRQSRMAALMKGRSWRDVILFKEILDPPVSVRESNEPSDPFAY